MSRLNEAFERLITSHPAADPDEVLAAARLEITGDRSHRRSILGLGAAAAIIAIVAAIVVLAGSDPSDEVSTGPADSTTSQPAATRAVEVHFSAPTDPTCQGTTAVDRHVQASQPIEGAVSELLAGPTTAEADAGLGSFFSASTADALRSIEAVDGTAYVDLDNIAPLLNNASTSCGSNSLLAQLDATVTQFEHVHQAIYSFEGNPDLFYSWLQRETPQDARPQSPPKSPETYVWAGPRGVRLEQAGGATELISTDPAATAFAIGSEFVVYQGIDSTVGADWPGRGAGPVWVWTASGVVQLPAMPEGGDQQLLDAARVNGRPSALVADRDSDPIGESYGPLVLVDLQDQSRTTLVRNSRLDPEFLTSRLLPDGDILALITAEDDVEIVRWAPGEEDPEWRNLVDRDTVDGLAVLGDEAALIESRIHHAQATPFGIADINLETGELGLQTQFSIGASELRPGTARRCSGWWGKDTIVCGWQNGTAFAVGFDGSVTPINASPGAVVTAAR